MSDLAVRANTLPSAVEGRILAFGIDTYLLPLLLLDRYCLCQTFILMDYKGLRPKTKYKEKTKPKVFENLGKLGARSVASETVKILTLLMISWPTTGSPWFALTRTRG